MDILEWVETGLVLFALLCSFTSMFLTYLVSKKYIKVVDKLALGYEIQNDNLFMLMLRVPNYGLAFVWKFYAKRLGLLEKFDSLDNKTKRPFVMNFWLLNTAVGLLIIAVLIGKYSLHIIN